MGPTIRDNSMMREAIKLARDGELGNSDAIRLLQIPHRTEDVKEVLQKFEKQLTREAKSKLTLDAFVPRPDNVDNQRYEPIFDRYLITGKTYTTASGTVVLNEIQYYNGEMVQIYGDCTNVAQVIEALAGSGYKPMMMKQADGHVVAIAQLWAYKVTDTSIRPYNAMFIVVPAVRDDTPACQASIKADDNGASSALSMRDGSFDPAKAVYENRARLFFVRLLDTTKTAIEIGRERMGTDKRAGTVHLTREGRLLALSIRDKEGQAVARSNLVLADDPMAYVSEVAKAAATAGIAFAALPPGTEYVYPSVARIGQGPLVNWEWRTDVVGRLQPVGPNTIVFDSASEEGEILIKWGFRPKVLGFIPNVRGVVTGVPENPSVQRLTEAPATGTSFSHVSTILDSAAASVRDNSQVPRADEQRSSTRIIAKKVVVIGGGIAGLSAAHELIERGFTVEVYEGRQSPGGKARSMAVPSTGKRGVGGMRKDLPGEHGFRFFPRFYKHVIDTMERIPCGDRTVEDNLVDTTRLELARFGSPPVLLPSRSPRSLRDVKLMLEDLRLLYAGDLGISHQEMAFFAARVWQIITSCHERRSTEYEKLDWWDFIDAERYSPAYQKLLGHGITRSLVAAKAHLASTKTIGDIFVQLLFDIAKPGHSTDRVLNGPTSDVWISPWVEYLTSRGVQFHFGAKASAITCSRGRIQNVICRRERGSLTVEGDMYVFAVPVERMAELLTPEMLAADPSLANLRPLRDATDWMNGVQLYLTDDLKLPPGHTIYVDSPWALTSINQSQFWPDIDLSQYGDGTIKDIISIDISEWESKGLSGKTAKECTAEEVRAEVWEQMKRSLNVGGKVILKDEQLHAWFLDPSISLSSVAPDINEEPLLVNLVNTWALRPEAVTQIPNMFLASDYVRTNTDLATMEGANEAARRAVNGILQVAAIDAPPCEIWQLHEPEIFAPWRAIDRVRFRQGLPWDDTLVVLAMSALDVAEKAIAAAGMDSGARPGASQSAAMDMSAVERLQPSFADQEPPELIQAASAVVERIVQVASASTLVRGGDGLAPKPSVPEIMELGATGGQAANASVRSGRVRIFPQ